MQRNCTHATKASNRSPACPWARPWSCNCAPPLPSTSPGTNPASNVPRAMLQHVSGYETQGKRSPLRANTEPHPRNETAPMQRCPPLPARIRARDRPQPFSAPCRSTWAATIHEGNIPRAVLAKKEIASTQRNCAHATNPPKPLPSTSPGTKSAPTVPRAML